MAYTIYDAFNWAKQIYLLFLYGQGNVQNHLIQFELLLTAATFVAALFAAVAGIFGMNFTASIFDYHSAFNWVLIITGIACGLLYFLFLLYFKHKKVFPL